QLDAKAASLYDPSNPQSLDLVASLYAKGGFIGRALEVEKVKVDLTKKSYTEMLAQGKMEDAKNQVNGGIIKSMAESPEAYRAGQAQLERRGVKLSDYGLTGDPSQDT